MEIVFQCGQLSIGLRRDKNLSLGFQTRRDSNQSPQLQRLARKLKISPATSLDMVLFKE